MEVVIFGLPKSGKTTVFNALTRGDAPVTAYSTGNVEPNVAVVKVPDERLDVLTQMFKPRKTTPATIKYVDVAGMTTGGEKGHGMSPAYLGWLRTADALMHVVRAFDDPQVPHPNGSVDPMRDIEEVDLEMTFADMAIIEKRLERVEASMKSAKQQEREAAAHEKELLLRLRTALEAGTPIRDLDLSEEEAHSLRGYQFLTAKPLLILLNTGEEVLLNAGKLSAQIREQYTHRHTAIDELCGKLEMELGQLEPEDAQVFMEDLGIKESGLDRVIKITYDLVGLLSFLTTGPDEVRAWTIERGTHAPQAAGAIHSDIERGFIRAEVVAFNDLVAAGGMNEAKKRGTFRQEGKNYVVKDGDVINFLFNV